VRDSRISDVMLHFVAGQTDPYRVMPKQMVRVQVLEKAIRFHLLLRIPLLLRIVLFSDLNLNRLHSRK
jgi:hypothetical protein